MAYIYAFILTAMVTVLVELVTPFGEGGRGGASIRLVTGLCLLLALIHPLKEGIALLTSLSEGDWSFSVEESLPEGEEGYRDLWENELAVLGQREAEMWVKDVLQEQFGISSENLTCTVTVSASDETPTVTLVFIELKGTAIFKNPHDIEGFITDRTGWPCSVSVG